MINEDIIRLIKQGANSQQELLTELRALGHNLTQSSISRKLQQLGVSKLHGKYQQTVANLDIGLQVSFVPPNLLVVRTPPGHAGTTATRIDQQLVTNDQYPEFIGSIAGDDTIFVAINLDKRSFNWAIEQIKKL